MSYSVTSQQSAGLETPADSLSAITTSEAAAEDDDKQTATDRENGLEAPKAEDEQSGHDASKPDSIPRETVEKWLGEARTALDRLQGLKELRTLLQEVSTKINDQDTEHPIDSNAPDEVSEDGEGSQSGASEEESIAIPDSGTKIDKAIPQVKYVSWKDAADRSQLTGEYHAIHVPYEEPKPTEIVWMAKNEWSLGIDNPKEPQKTDTQLVCPERLPERIKISSRRLRCFLDYEFGNGRLRFRYGRPFTLLRPFKILIYWDKKLREKVDGLERDRDTRKETWEHIDTVNDDSFEWHDGNWYGAYESFSDLTAFIRESRCLIQFIDEHLLPERNRLAAGPQKVRFDDLYFVFPRGSLVYVKDPKIPQRIWKVIQGIGGRRYMGKPRDMGGEYQPTFSPFVLDCFFLDYDGEHFVPIYRSFEISDFEGDRTLKLLPVVPLVVAQRDLELVDKQALIDRGRQFVECTSNVFHLEFSGRSHYLTPNGKRLLDLVDKPSRSALFYSERIDSEVIVDFPRALEAVPEWRSESNTYNPTKTDEAEIGDRDDTDNDEQWEQKMTEEFLEGEGRKWRGWSEGVGPSEDDDLLLLPDRVFAFVLSSRQWACLKIGKGSDGTEQLRQRSPEDKPWEKLQLPQGHKELVQSLITSHFSRLHSKKVHFDLLKNKGNGVIILLHGVPGVGKTSTAECAAMSNDKPLLPITCGDLGLTAGEVEDKLKEIFRLAQDWGCVLLLDEADVFLAQRSVNDTQRNALVSVFLRTLEYYEGILFLTTNRVGIFDEAFKSRIHMSLYYPGLDSAQTIMIWRRHIKEAIKAGIQVDEDELITFGIQAYQSQIESSSHSVWNGRQIRNAFQSAVALAAFHSNEGPIHLERKYFENVFKVSDQFSDYIWQTKNRQTDADRNRLGMTRRDDYSYQPSTGEAALHAQMQYKRAPGAIQSTFRQPTQQPSPNFGLQNPPQGGSLGGLASFPAQAQRFGSMQAAATQQAQNPATGVGGQQSAAMFQNQTNTQANYTLASQQPQYAPQQANFGITGQQMASRIQLPMDPQMFPPVQTIPRG